MSSSCCNAAIPEKDGASPSGASVFGKLGDGEVLVVMGIAGEDVGKSVGVDRTGLAVLAADAEGPGATAGEDGHCNDVLPAHDLVHCWPRTALTTLASKMDEPQTYRSRPATGSQLEFSTV